MPTSSWRVLWTAVIALSIVILPSGPAVAGDPRPDGSSGAATAVEGPIVSGLPVDSTTGSRILLYGDSFTMGFSGDWTFRYRLWRHLTSSGTQFDFVGPRNDMREYVSRQLGSQGYRDSNFDRDHASLGGMTFSRPLWEVSTLVQDYQADVVVGFVGANDIVQRLQTPAQLVERWRAQIAEARANRPGTDFVLVQMPDTWFAGIPAYNAGLVALAHELDTADSRVVATDLAQFDPHTDTYDFAHPSASGERKVAALVSTTLASIGIGTGPQYDLMDPSASVAWAPTPRATVKAGVLTVSWAAVDYASSQDVHITDIAPADGGALSSETTTRVTGTTWSRPVEAGHRYLVALAPVKGFLPMGTMSTPVTVSAAPITALR